MPTFNCTFKCAKLVNPGLKHSVSAKWIPDGEESETVFANASDERPTQGMTILDAGRRDCLRKMKHGAMLGAGVGGAAGFLFGSYEAVQIRGIPMSQKMGLALRNTVGGSLVFGFFLAIGTGIRSCSTRERF